jgi:hypothetical protein
MVQVFTFVAATQIHMPFLLEWWTFKHIFTLPKS